MKRKEAIKFLESIVYDVAQHTDVADIRLRNAETGEEIVMDAQATKSGVVSAMLCVIAMLKTPGAPEPEEGKQFFVSMLQTAARIYLTETLQDQEACEV